MTPLARAELHRYVQDAAKVRKAREKWTGADIADAIVAFITFNGLVFLAGFGVAEYQHDTRATACASHTTDGRVLTAYHITKDGADRCVYAAPQPIRKGVR